MISDGERPRRGGLGDGARSKLSLAASIQCRSSTIMADRLAPSARARERRHDLGQAREDGFRRDPRRQGRAGSGIAEELEERAGPLPRARERPRDAPRDLVASRLVGLLRGDPEVRAQEIERNPERQRSAVRRTAHAGQPDAVATAALGELVAERALSDSGLADDGDRCRPRPREPPERIVEEGGYGVAADQPDSPRARDTSKRERGGPKPSSSWTRTGASTPSPASGRARKRKTLARCAVLLAHVHVTGAAICSIRAARFTVAPCAVSSMRRSSPILPRRPRHCADPCGWRSRARARRGAAR